MQILKNLWKSWKSLARKIGEFQSKVILTVFYFLLAPFGLFFSIFKDELKMKKQTESSWIIKHKQSESLTDLSRQF